ncbi:hypothetical protein QQS21_010332 [Conoideocrella luteorostrata]|uniref:DUF3669 domain-containing protein n=1 Tax=Conoideocrella luteorostrata TaxID=1105319 RepID=A0AAJ0FWY8_9HYPO|nr:hypothetical protein QQS21_010332 [Conoideocrella luteorostrata]
MDSNNITLFATNSLRRIGFGHCGSVWGTLRSSDAACSHIPIVIKREDASPGRDIENEVLVQSQICAERLSSTLIPRCLGLVDSQDKRWDQILPLLPQGSERCRAMISEKIGTLSIQAQALLVDMYSPEANRDMLKRDLYSGKSEHCLARIYLGRRRQARPSQGQKRRRFFSLRNFPLHVDQAEELGLPCRDYAKAMAEALATLHWKFRTNAADVEFVLGARRGLGGSNIPLGQHVLWVLDFDCCQPIKADESGLELIARAFWRNDPYYPRAGSALDRDQELWDIFAAEYLQVGIKMARNYPRKGEMVEDLCTLVHGAVRRIVETKEKWKGGAHP